MKTEFANEQDVFDYIIKHKLRLVVFDECWWFWRSIFLVFEDKTYMRLELKDCYTYKFFKWKFYDGEIKVVSLNGIECNYNITLTDIDFRNNIIDGIEAEEKRLENRASEVFTNEVRVGNVFFHYHEGCEKTNHSFNPNDYKIIPMP